MLLQGLQTCWEFLPISIILVLFAAEVDRKTTFHNTFIGLGITITILILLYLLLVYMNINWWFAIVFAGILFVVLIMMKKWYRKK